MIDVSNCIGGAIRLNTIVHWHDSHAVGGSAIFTRSDEYTQVTRIIHALMEA